MSSVYIYTLLEPGRKAVLRAYACRRRICFKQDDSLLTGQRRGGVELFKKCVFTVDAFTRRKPLIHHRARFLWGVSLFDALM